MTFFIAGSYSKESSPHVCQALCVDRWGKGLYYAMRKLHGDPTVASAEKGERMLSAIVDSLNEVVEDILADRLWSRLIEPSAGFARGELRRSL